MLSTQLTDHDTLGVSKMVVMCLCIISQDGNVSCTAEVCNGTSSEEGEDGGGILDPGAPTTQAPATTQPAFVGQYV